MNTLTITRPDDWHLHLRDGDMLAAVVPDTARQFARAIVMPNLDPPVTTAKQALAYRQRILDVVPEGLRFEPLMTLYLTDQTSPDEIGIDPCVHAVKWYPAGATTNSSRGVTDISRCYKVLEKMQEHDGLLTTCFSIKTPFPHWSKSSGAATLGFVAKWSAKCSTMLPTLSSTGRSRT